MLKNGFNYFFFKSRGAPRLWLEILDPAGNNIRNAKDLSCFTVPLKIHPNTAKSKASERARNLQRDSRKVSQAGSRVHSPLGRTRCRSQCRCRRSPERPRALAAEAELCLWDILREGWGHGEKKRRQWYSEGFEELGTKWESRGGHKQVGAKTRWVGAKGDGVSSQ